MCEQLSIHLKVFYVHEFIICDIIVGGFWMLKSCSVLESLLNDIGYLSVSSRQPHYSFFWVTFFHILNLLDTWINYK